MLQVLCLDPFDPLRVDLAPALKREGQTWVAKYAKAGRTDAPSAQKVRYTVALTRERIMAMSDNLITK